ncbi:MAG TPA: prepilin-type N-terminal cleavage/methylation domain-containing protein [Candidatus Saccharimonadales bacterium]|nr:prepilin-type N-terminal cleavage/methylation domain-containing protein [Candidatus Saccharimonadales bacterium]
MNKMKKGFALVGRRGFTLIELLVVIAIIGILAALIITSLTGARLRAADTQTKNNLRTLSTTLEQYYSDQTTGAYPTAAANGVNINGGTVSNCANAGVTLGACLASYVTGGATSQVFTGYNTAKYTSNATTTNYAAAAALQNGTEGTVATGNGEYLAGATGTVTPGNGAAYQLTTMGNNVRAWVVYGPQ